MKQKIQISESLLRQMISRAINESLNEFYREEFEPSDITPDSWVAIQKWAVGVRNGMDYRDNRIFGPFYNALYNNAKLKYVVLKAFGFENTDITTIEETNENGEKIRVDRPDRPSLDTYRMCKDGMDNDVISEFFAGISQLAKDGEESDAFPGQKEDYNLDKFVEVILNNPKDPIVFIHKLSNFLGFYSRHYFRKHYSKNVLQYGNRSKSIDNPNSKQIGVYDDDDFKADAAGDTDANDDLGAAEEKSAGDSAYYARMCELVKEIIADESNTLSPQERKILQGILDVVENGMSQENLNKLADLSDKQQAMTVYGEVAKRLGIDTKKVQKVYSAALAKARQTKQAKMLKEKKKLVKRIVNETIKRILKMYLK